MAANSRRLKEREDILSSLDESIEAMNLAKEVSGIPPVKDTFGSVGLLLKIIRVCFLFCDDELLVYIQPELYV